MSCPLYVYPLQLHFQLGARRQQLPAYLGAVLRGAFAGAFRRLVCVTEAPTCDGCLLLSRCAYPYLFETQPPKDLPAAIRRRYRQAPRPYIFQIPQAYRGDAHLSCGLVLVGKAIEFLPYIVHVLENFGKHGFGRVRVEARLAAITDLRGATVFDAEERVLQESVQAVDLTNFAEHESVESSGLTLEFLTPLRIKKFGDYREEAERITFAVLFELLVGRMAALSLFHCGEPWAPDPSFRSTAREIAVVEKSLSLHYLERYSSRHKRALPLHGLVGRITFEGPLTEFIPFLRLGEFLHIGANTAFGLGQYRLSQI